MAIFRGDLPAETRTYYGLTAGESTLPSLISDNELLSWGKRIIEGEEFRIKKGGNPISNPSIAVVKVRFEQFLNQLNHYQALNKITSNYALKNNAHAIIRGLRAVLCHLVDACLQAGRAGQGQAGRQKRETDAAFHCTARR